MSHTDDKTRAQNTAQEVKDETRRSAKSLAEEAKTAARDTANQAAESARSQAESAKNSVAGEVSNVARALRKAAEESREGSPQERTFGQIAEGLADMSETVARKDLGEMARDLSDFARRNPLAFLGGAALIGFAATRFAKAGQRPAEPAGTQPYGSDDFASRRPAGTPYGGSSTSSHEGRPAHVPPMNGGSS